MQTVTIDRSKRWKAEDYFLLGEMSSPCQLINGELFMSPAPNPLHQMVLSNLNDIIRAEGKKEKALVLFAPVDLIIDEQNVYQPDLLLLKTEKIGLVTEKGIEGPPDLIAEVISPSNSFADRYEKKDRYQQFGVSEYWILDPANETLEIYAGKSWTKPQLYLAGEGAVRSSVLKNLDFDLQQLF